MTRQDKSWIPSVTGETKWTQNPFTVVTVPRVLLQEISEFIDDQLCDCHDEYGKPKPMECDRCMLLAKLNQFWER